MRALNPKFKLTCAKTGLLPIQDHVHNFFSIFHHFLYISGYKNI